MPSVAQMAATSSSPMSKKRRREDWSDSSDVQRKFLGSYSIQAFSPERLQLAAKRRIHDVKRQRILLSSPQGQNNSERPSLIGCDANTISSNNNIRKEGKVDLSPCHICRRKPTERSQLDAYADCEGCGERTCYICIRECEGLGSVGHTSMGGFDFMGLDRFGPRGNGSREGGNLTWQEELISGHRRRICSGCCEERGAEGEVWCKGCVKAAVRD